ncbi:hypothetical protein ABT236_38185 [Streptomyces sp. NPDC001523]
MADSAARVKDGMPRLTAVAVRAVAEYIGESPSSRQARLLLTLTWRQAA